MNLTDYVTAGKKSGSTLGSKATAEGNNNIASGDYSHAEGSENQATSYYSHVEGSKTKATLHGAHAEGLETEATNYQSHAEGYQTIASGSRSHTEGWTTIASGTTAHAEGWNRIASGNSSHAEGNGHACNLTISGAANATQYTYSATATVYSSYAYDYLRYNNEVRQITAIDTTNKKITVNSSFGIALNNASATIYGGAFGTSSHAEGTATVAAGLNSHSEGNITAALGSNSHAEGLNTIATRRSQHVFGEYNVADASSVVGTSRGTYVEIVGKGTANNSRSNARTLDWSGNESLAGGLTLGMGTNDEVTLTAAQLKQLLALLS